VRSAVILLVMMRAGLLGAAFALFTMFAFIEIPLTLDVTAWYAAHALPVLVPWLAAVAYAFHTALGGQPLLGQGLLED
jgi:hypothetical protein